MKRSFIICGMIICLLLTCSCSKKDRQPEEFLTEIILSTETVEVTKGDTYQVTYAILPESDLNWVLDWQSTDESTVTVNDDGVITAVGVGQANVIATSQNGIYATCKVTVKELPAYDRLDSNEKKLVDAFIAGVDIFYNPQSTSLKYAYYHSATASWAITVSAQNKMGGYSEKDYTLYEDGRIEEVLLNHIRMPGDYYDLDLINEAIKELAH